MRTLNRTGRDFVQTKRDMYLTEIIIFLELTGAAAAGGLWEWWKTDTKGRAVGKNVGRMWAVSAVHVVRKVQTLF